MIAFVNQWELLVILVVVLLLFGHRLPGMARSLGSGITEFKRGLKEGNGTSSGTAKGPDVPPAPPTRNPDAPNDGSAR